jgi:hypothetical protein
MIIWLEEARGWHENDGTVNWARQEGRGMINEEFEAPDGNQVVGDRLYEGTPGQACCAKLMDLLFDSPASRAQCREG